MWLFILYLSGAYLDRIPKQQIMFLIFYRAAQISLNTVTLLLCQSHIYIMFVIDGKEAKAVSRSQFVKMAGHSYRNLTDAERKVLAVQISADDDGIMTPVEVEGQVRRITKKMKSQAGSGLGCLGGFFYRCLLLRTDWN